MLKVAYCWCCNCCRFQALLRPQYSTGHLPGTRYIIILRNRSAGSGWMSYSRKGAFFTILSTKAPPVLRVSRFKSRCYIYCPVSHIAVCVSCIVLDVLSILYEWAYCYDSGPVLLRTYSSFARQKFKLNYTTVVLCGRAVDWDVRQLTLFDRKLLPTQITIICITHAPNRTAAARFFNKFVYSRAYTHALPVNTTHPTQ